MGYDTRDIESTATVPVADGKGAAAFISGVIMHDETIRQKHDD